MSMTDTVNAWQDDYVRAVGHNTELAHPAGLVELAQEDLETVAGGRPSNTHTEVCCHCTC